MADVDARLALSPHTAAASAALTSAANSSIARARQGGLDVTVRLEGGFLWTVLSRGNKGGLALRMPAISIDAQCVDGEPLEDALAVVECRGSLGTGRLVVRGDDFDLEQVRATLDFTPTRDLELSPIPRDLIPFTGDGDPLGTKIAVEAEQRKMNVGLLYFTLERPDFGKVLYVQNLTALNDYFNTTGSKPESTVGSDGSELGYSPPMNPDTGKVLLPAGRTLRLYDTIVSVRGYPQGDEADSAWQFLDMLGGVYPWLNPPRAEYRDWPSRAQATVDALTHAPELRIEHYGHSYFHPYTASEYPDLMVELSIASAMEEWGQWNGVRHPMVREILGGIERFHDRELGTLRRYLPNVGPDKNADAVDSWYLYHPMLNLANLALAGYREARDLFLATIDYGIRVARHFEYKWPILYDIRDLSVIRAVTEADGRGQTDVGGIYAWVMLQAHELTLERRYIDEAVAAIEAARGMRFDLNYQANLTAWGATACIRLWRVTNRKEYLTQSYVYLASFFHNSQIWDSRIGLAAHWKNFLGVTCLQDAPYMAAYECFDSFAAFERYLDYGGPDLIPAVKLLVGEYCNHALDRAWFYYPDALPGEAIAPESRNGYIRTDLSIPLEDLYPDGQPAGQVGQEVYGSGAAMVFATRAFTRIAKAPFLVFCNTFIRAVHRLDEHTVSLRLDGHAGDEASLILTGEREAIAAARPRLKILNGSSVRFREIAGRLEARTPADASLLLAWDNHGSGKQTGQDSLG